jgi:hypothetical protein
VPARLICWGAVLTPGFEQGVCCMSDADLEVESLSLPLSQRSKLWLRQPKRLFCWPQAAKRALSMSRMAVSLLSDHG